MVTEISQLETAPFALAITIMGLRSFNFSDTCWGSSQLGAAGIYLAGGIGKNYDSPQECFRVVTIARSDARETNLNR